MSAFDVKRNPFIVLGTSPRSARGEINGAFQDKSLDAETPEEERRLDMARQALFTPRDRLLAELTYLLEMRPADVRATSSADRPNAWVEIANSTTGVARANALAQACVLDRNQQKSRELVRLLIGSHEAIDVTELLDTVQQQRAVSGFDKISRQNVETGLAELGTIHAEVIVENLSRHPHFAAEIVHILENYASATGLAQRLIRQIMDAYERAITKDLDNKSEEVIAALQTFSAWSSKGSFDQFEASLRGWGKLAHPLQISDSMLGADEAHSKVLFGRIRGLATELAGEKDRYSDALLVVRLARDVFAELPDTTAKLEEDITALESIEEELGIQEVLGPLLAAVEAAEADITGTIRALAKRGFFSTAASPVGEVARAYQEIAEGRHPERIQTLAIGLVRQLAIVLNNDHNDPDGSAKIISQLRAGPNPIPHSAAATLDGDQRALDREKASTRLQTAMREGDLKLAKLACEKMIALSDGEEKGELLLLHQKIESRISSGRTKAFLGWGAAAAFVLFLIASESDNGDNDVNPPYNASTDYDAVLEGFSEAAPGIDPAGLNEDVEQAIDAVMGETPPQLYGSTALNRAQLRYCLKQAERITAARSYTNSSAQLSRFNTAVDDYNGRCGQFTYQISDKVEIDAEIQLERTRLNEQGRALVGPVGVPEVKITEPDGATAERILPGPTNPRDVEGEPDSMDQLVADLEQDASRE